ncbi:MAG: TetR/AcrR family transcriptional regulator [Magnetospirillum sp.]|nr:TetR/AcrR family transcriptional regulator [Magnetospirillum sp.]
MAKKSHGPEQIITAALHLAAEKGWRTLSLADVAEQAAVPLAELVEHFPSKGAILDAYVRRVDSRMMEGGIDRDESPRDRLFEVIMRRFDAMAADRTALERILRQSADDPWSVLCGGRRFLHSMALALETAGISSSGLPGLVKTNAVAAIYLYSFKTFLADDSADHARTMAALDKGLRRAEDWAALIFRQKAHTRTMRHPAESGDQTKPNGLV